MLIGNIDSLTTPATHDRFKIVRRRIRLLLVIVRAPTFSTHLVLLPSSPSGCQAGDRTTGARRLPSWRGIKPVPSRPGKGVRGESTVRPRGGTGFQRTCCQFATVKELHAAIGGYASPARPNLCACRSGPDHAAAMVLSGSNSYAHQWLWA